MLVPRVGRCDVAWKGAVAFTSELGSLSFFPVETFGVDESDLLNEPNWPT